MCLYPGVDTIKYYVLLEQVLNNKSDGLFSKEGVQGYLEVFADFFETVDSTVT